MIEGGGAPPGSSPGPALIVKPALSGLLLFNPPQPGLPRTPSHLGGTPPKTPVPELLFYSRAISSVFISIITLSICSNCSTFFI